MPAPASTLSPPRSPTPPRFSRGKYVVGVCAMDCKARSKPMRHILNRLLSYGDFDIVIFGDKTILDEDIRNWPRCDFLICFFSGGFPLEKAIAYVKLRNPFVVNNVCMQTLLWDRRVVLAILDAIGVPTPPRVIISRDGGARVSQDAAEGFEECTGLDLENLLAKYAANSTRVSVTTEGVAANGESLTKAFIEKPVNGEDHNINIYYSKEQGSGGRRLFRKIGNKSSEFDPELVLPAAEGSFVYEKLMETEKCEDIKIYTVGPTFIHAETRKSPTVDGLVKRNTDGKEIRYCIELSDEEKEIARKISKAFGQTVCGLDLLRVRGRSYVIDVNGWSFVKGNEHYYDQCARLMSEAFYQSCQRRLSLKANVAVPLAHSWRLKGFVAVFRHGDRTPKDKCKVSVRSKPFFALLQGSTQEVVLRQRHQLESVIEAVEQCLPNAEDEGPDLLAIREILKQKSDLPGTKVQLKPKYDAETKALKKVQVIVKWGGELTHAGLYQARDLGENLRKDMNILNREVMEDVKIYSSSERRVRATADIFAHSFLGQSQSLQGIISESKYLLDDSNASKEQSDVAKEQLKRFLQHGQDLSDDTLNELGWSKDLAQPHVVYQQMSALLARMQVSLRANWAAQDVHGIQNRWCCFESPQLFKERWEKTFRNFCTRQGDGDDAPWAVEVSSIPALYDTLKYDALHNRPFLRAIFATPDAAQTQDDLRELYKCVKALFDLVAPQEFGISAVEKKDIGMLIGLPLLKNILTDLDDMTMTDIPKTRLYFTKESHVHALLNLVYLSGVQTKVPRNTLPELDFLTQITFELYERERHDGRGKEYSLRIAFSPGAHYDSVLDLRLDSEHCVKVAPRQHLIPHLALEEVLHRHKGYLNVPNLKVIEQQIDERMLFYAQEDNH